MISNLITPIFIALAGIVSYSILAFYYLTVNHQWWLGIISAIVCVAYWAWLAIMVIQSLTKKDNQQ